MAMGDRGRIVIPAEIRDRRGWKPGTPLIAIETESGIVLAERDDLERLIRAQFGGRDLVSELLEERRAAAAAEDAE